MTNTFAHSGPVERFLNGRNGRAASVILQLTVSQSPFKDLEIQELSEVSYLADLGFKKGLGPSRVFFVALSENLLNFKNSPDVGFHAGITQTLGTPRDR